MGKDVSGDNDDDRKEGRGVQSVEVGAKLLAALVDGAEPMMLKEVARASGIAPAQAHAYLVSYRKLGLVEQQGTAGRYRLGPFALELGITRMRTFDPLRMAGEGVMDLSRRTGLNVALLVWGSFGPTVIQVQESGSQLNMNTRVGTVYSLTGTATGRVFAAFLPELLIQTTMRNERRDNIVNAVVGRAQSLTKADILQIREAGYATIVDPPVPGINAISAPVFDHVGQMQFALTLIGLDSMLRTEPGSDHVAVLLSTTEQLSAQLGYLKALGAHQSRGRSAVS